MRRPFPAILAGLALLLAGQAAMALGLGRVSTQSYLGNPLEFSIALSAVPSDALSADCITADVFAGDSRVSPEMVRVRVNRNAEGTPTSLRIITGTRIDEPVASVELTLDCGTRMSRRYVVFVDPPIVNMAQAEGGEPAVASAVPRRPMASRDIAPSASPRRSRATRSAATTVQPGGTGTASAARQRRIARAEAARTARAAAAATAPAERGSRLKLESAPAISAGAPVKERVAAGAPGSASAVAGGLAVATAAAGAAAASAPPSAASGAASAAGLLGELVAKAEADALALNAERLRALEERMNRLRTDNTNLQKSMADLQTRLAEAEATRYANPLVYGLVAALALLLLAVIALLWRQASLRKESDWLKAAAADNGERRGDTRSPAARSAVTPTSRGAAVAALAAGAGAAGAAAASTARPAHTGEETSPAAALRPPAEPALDEGAVVSEAPSPAPVPAPAPVATGPHESTSVHQADREVTVEELIDLEQQADFFVVLGQDDAAIDLLMGHVQGTGGASPLPYLKLLEIHRRRDEREAYDRVRERFNRRFSAFAPEWEAHTGHDRALEDYPAVIERLQGLWPEPTKAMDALAGLLFQRDLTAQTYDLPAYGELLFLYSLARERAEHEPPPGGVDLLLPLDDGPSATDRAPAVGLAAALGAAGAAGAATAMARVDDDLPSLDPLPLSDLPESSDLLPQVPATYPVPLTLDRGDRSGGAGDGLLDLNISDDPEEPKGPLSKW